MMNLAELKSLRRTHQPGTGRQTPEHRAMISALMRKGASTRGFKIGLLALVIGEELPRRMRTQNEVARAGRRLRQQDNYEYLRDALSMYDLPQPDAWYITEDSNLVIQEVVHTQDIDDLIKYANVWAFLDCEDAFHVTLEIYTTHAGGGLAATYNNGHWFKLFYGARS